MNINLGRTDAERSSLLRPGSRSRSRAGFRGDDKLPERRKMVKAVLYAVQVYYSFFTM